MTCCKDYVQIGNICVECEPGYWSHNCSSPCPPNHYGRKCSQICDCSPSEYCDVGRGCLRKETSPNYEHMVTATTEETPKGPGPQFHPPDLVANEICARSVFAHQTSTIRTNFEIPSEQRIFPFVSHRHVFRISGTFECCLGRFLKKGRSWMGHWVVFLIKCRSGADALVAKP
ncbi:uncharacterized protein LOC125656893 isoform X2 [Ostrea edulis]|uniref:uncharacterized protein LOC125656893 isoform X2 n=1 Tax=Ostrea edulis TaxID=37623 RepID=UPI0024AF6DC9|nr:uncharacterized protein LOC125656893 isoform X2 [Ostrea edulis]